jgi:multisubunit Na+/H+ antiporter MnhC subunit
MTAMELHWLLYTAAFGLIVIGIVGVVILTDIFRIILALVIAEAGANLLLVIAGYRFEALAPILTTTVTSSANMVDPVPQAMVLTSIVIGVGIQALALALVVRVYEHYHTLDLGLIHQRLLSDIDEQSGVRPLLSPHKPSGKRPLPEPVAYHDIARGGK